MTDRGRREELVIRAIAEILEVPPERIDRKARMREDLGMDSLGTLELLSTLSRQLGVDIEIEEALEIVTVEDALRFVEEHAAARGADAAHAE